MKEKGRKIAIGICLILLCAAVGGCGKKEKDPATEQVLEISITPIVTPTPKPSETNPDAVTVNGDITMVNTYLLEKGSTETKTNEETDGQEQQGEEETEAQDGENQEGSSEE